MSAEMLTKIPKPPSPVVTDPDHGPPGCGEEADAARWLGRLTARRILAPERPGPYTLGAGRSIDVPAGSAEHLLYLVVSGGCAVDTGPRRLRLDPGTVLWVRPGTPFSLTAPSGRPTVLHPLRLAGDPETDRDLAPVVLVRDAWELRWLVEALPAELASALPHRKERLRGMLLVLFSSLLRRAEMGDEPGVLGASARRAVERFVDEHISGRPRAADLARVAGLSPDYFTRMFRRTYGMPPREWIIHRRIQHAATHLDRTTSIGQVAARYGYADGFLFSRQFKAVMGVSPQLYRSR
ncbi:AraC family transcriptional regulator [Streptomyces sp. NPDC088182]|uniref:AraC family transcriptional regulator n=1 Tax=Streptomyces sp. NPDC088182 TaxID=3365838 RepID=UPI00382B1BB9